MEWSYELLSVGMREDVYTRAGCHCWVKLEMSQTQTGSKLCYNIATTEDRSCFVKINLFSSCIRKLVQNQNQGFRLQYSTVLNVSRFFTTTLPGICHFCFSNSHPKRVKASISHKCIGASHDIISY